MIPSWLIVVGSALLGTVIGMVSVVVGVYVAVRSMER
jgi:hypothetical protein